MIARYAGRRCFAARSTERVRHQVLSPPCERGARGSQGGVFLARARGTIGSAIALRGRVDCFWHPLLRERAGVRGQRHPAPSQVESPDTHPLSTWSSRPSPQPSPIGRGCQYLAAPRLSSRPQSLAASHSIRAAVLLQSTPHHRPFLEEREILVTKTPPCEGAKGGGAGASNRLSAGCRALAALLVTTSGLLLFAGCGMTRTKEGAATKAPDSAIERSAEKGPVKLFVRVWPREPRLSDLVEMEVRVESQPGTEIKPPAFGQAVGDFLIRDYSERPAEAGARRCAGSIISWSRHTRAST